MTSWTLTRSHLVGKLPDQDRCEDQVVATSAWAAVIDGTTPTGCATYQIDGSSVTGGRFVAVTLARAFDGLEPHASARVAVDYLTEVLRTAIDAQHPHQASHLLPSASVTAVNLTLNTAWLVGDTQLAVEDIHGNVHLHVRHKPIRAAAALARCALLGARAAAGQPWNPDGIDPDPSQAVIAPLLAQQDALANSDSEWGHGALNGLHVPARFIDEIDLYGALRVVAATDGYPQLAPWGELKHMDAEQWLAQALMDDPTCTRLLAGLSARAAGNASFSDRAWVELIRRN